MGSGCKYGWSFVRLPAAHHLRYSLAPDGAMDQSMAQGLGDPRLRACGKHWPLAPLFLVIAGPVHSVDVSRLVLPLVLCVFEGDRGEWDIGWWPWGEAPSVTGHLAERVIQHRGPEWAALNLCPNPNLTFKYIYLYIKESACDAGDQGLIPGLGSSSGEGNGNALLYCCLENSMDRSLAGYSPWGRKELGMTEWLTHIHIFFLFTHLYIWLQRVLVAAYGSSSLTRDWTWVPLHWVCGVLATQPSGKSPQLGFVLPWTTPHCLSTAASCQLERKTSCDSCWTCFSHASPNESLKEGTWSVKGICRAGGNPGLCFWERFILCTLACGSSDQRVPSQWFSWTLCVCLKSEGELGEAFDFSFKTWIS